MTQNTSNTSTTNSSNTNSSMNNSYLNQSDPIIDTSKPIIYLKCIDFEDGYCKKYCNPSCTSCSDIDGTCSSYKNIYKSILNIFYKSQALNQNSTTNEVKENSFQDNFIKYVSQPVVSLFSIFRPQNMQQKFIVFNNLDLYNYHQTQFTGSLQRSLQFTNVLQQKCWSLVPFPEIQFWLNQPLPLPSYNPYTNIKFQSVNRADSIFLQNAKPFIAAYIPISFLIFLIFNRLFYFLNKRQRSSYFMSYSLWFYLAIIFFQRNTYSLTMLAFTYFQNLFSLTYTIHFTHCVTLVFLGLVSIILISLFPISFYLYKEKCKYFLVNVSFKKEALIFAFLLDFIKPVTQTLMHIFLFYHPQAQLLFLSLISTTTVMLIFLAEGKFSLFLCKRRMLIDVTIQFLMVLLNTLIYLKYYWIDKEKIAEITEQITVCILICIASLVIFDIAFQIIHFCVKKIVGLLKKIFMFLRKFPRNIKYDEQNSKQHSKQTYIQKGKHPHNNGNIISTNRKKQRYIFHVGQKFQNIHKLNIRVKKQNKKITY